jgi:thioesterase domain-containing protein/acyl carrier protein
MTMGSLSVSGESSLKERAGIPLTYTKEIEFISRDDKYEDGSALTFQQEIESLEELPAAIIIEVVQGEGGINVAHEQWLKELFEYSKQQDILMIVDDVQAGCGRTGRFFSFEHFDVKPDLVCLSKSIGGYGLPMSLVLIRPDLDVFSPAEHNGTFRGNNHAFITGAKAIEHYWCDTSFEQRVQSNADYLRQGLQALIAKYPELKGKYKGLGMIQGIECTPSSLVNKIKNKAFKQNLIIEAAGSRDQVLKFLPALTMTQEQLTECLTIIDSVIGQVLRPASTLMSTMPIGKPIGNVRVYIVDEHAQLIPSGAVGELLVAGDGLARGYFNQSEMTNERFVELRIEGRVERVYKTGDLVRYLPDGNIEFIGRIDNQVKIRGFRIELGEIEQTLSLCDEVTDAIVLAKENDSGDNRLVAYVVTDRVSEFTSRDQGSIELRHGFIEKLQEGLKLSLPDYMVPSTFVLLDKLPLTPNGKIDRKALPAPDMSLQQAVYVAPTSDTEKVLCEIWQEVLSLEKVGITDNFFDIGGHSLLAMKLIAMMNQQLQVTLSVNALFRYPSIVQLTQVMAEQTPGTQATDTLVKLHDAPQERPAIYMVAGAGGPLIAYQPFVEQMNGEFNVYGLQPNGIVDEPDVLSSIRKTAERYIDALKQVQPEGPYHFIGHSQGGKIIHEMAWLLQQRGDRTGLLMILDTNVPVESVIPVEKRSKRDEILSPLHVLMDFFNWSGSLDDEAYLALKPEQRVEWVYDKFTALDITMPHKDIEVYFKAQPAQTNMSITLNKGLQADEVVLVRSRQTELPDGSLLAELPEDWGWATLVDSPVTIKYVSGDHISMLQREHIGETVALVKASISRFITF